MTFQSTPIRVERLDRSKHGLVASFHDYIVGNRGNLDSRFSEYYPFLSICRFDEAPMVSPDILTVGSSAAQRQLFGDKWADAITYYKRTPDTSLEENAVIGYQQAAVEGFFCDLCETVVNLKGEPTYVSFVRHISLVNLKKGGKLFILAAELEPRILQ